LFNERVVEDCWEMSTSKEYISIDINPFGKTKSKSMRAYVQSRHYHTVIVRSHIDSGGERNKFFKRSPKEKIPKKTISTSDRL